MAARLPMLIGQERSWRNYGNYEKIGSSAKNFENVLRAVFNFLKETKSPHFDIFSEI